MSPTCDFKLGFVKTRDALMNGNLEKWKFSRKLTASMTKYRCEATRLHAKISHRSLYKCTQMSSSQLGKASFPENHSCLPCSILSEKQCLKLNTGVSDDAVHRHFKHISAAK